MTIFMTIISDTVCPSATSAVPVSPAPSRSTEKQSPADPRRPSKSAGTPAAWTPNPLLNRSSSQTWRPKKVGADRPVAQEGFTSTFSGWVGNPRDSHRVIQLGRTKGAEVEDRAAMAAMEMFFEGGGDFTSWDDLASGAETAGIEAAETKAWLEGSGGGEQVDSEVEQAHERGV